MKKRTIPWNEYQSLVNKICRDIGKSDWRPDYVIGITRGGLLPAVMVSHYFDIPCHTLKVCLRDHGDTESNLWMAEDAFRSKNILLIDDINDTGATINWIIEDWPAGCFPDSPRWQTDVWNKNVKFAVLFDNLASNCNVKMDFASEEVNKAENDTWLDFPYEEWWAK